MSLKPSLDMGVGVFYYLGAGVGALYLLFVAFIIEGLLLWGLLPGIKAFRDSFLINFISALLGVICTAILFQITFADYDGSYRIFYPDEATRQRMLYLPSRLILILWVLSVLIEGIILTVLEPTYRKREIWNAAIIVNIVSYLILFVAGWYFLSSF